MRLDFDYIIVDDDLKRSRTRRRVEKIQRVVDNKIRSKGLNPKPKLFESLDKFYQDEANLDRNRYDLYLSDNNLGNNGNVTQWTHTNDGIQLYLDLHSKFPCDFILYTGSTQDEIIDTLINHLNSTKDPGLFSRFTFISRSSDMNDNWHGNIEKIVDLIVSSREEMNTMRGLYAQLTSQIHHYLNKEFGTEFKFSRAINHLKRNISSYNLTIDDINKLHDIRRIRNGLMHNDEKKCTQSPHTYYLVYYKDDANTIEGRIYISDFNTVRTDLKCIYEKIRTAFNIA